MKTLLLFFCLISGFALYGQSSLSFDYGVSYGEGILSGLGFQSTGINTYFKFDYLEKSIGINKFFFLSDYISLGSISYSGFLRDLNGENFHYFSFDYSPEAEIYREGNPRNNFGVIFELPEIHWGCSFFRDDKISRVLLWKNFEIPGDGCINLSQTLTFAESLREIESWYVSEPALRSTVQYNSLLSVIFGNEDLFGGGQLHINTSPADPSGFSIFMIAGTGYGSLYFQNELRITSPEFVTSDLEPAEYPILFKGKVNFLQIPLTLNNSFYFFLKRERFPWENRLWKIKMNSELEYENNHRFFKGALEIAFFNSESELFLAEVNLLGSVKNQVGPLFWQIEGEAGYNSIFLYSLSLTGGYQSPFINIDFTSSLVIGRSISIDLSLKGRTILGRADLRTDFSLEDIGLYNSEKIKIKPYFFIGLEFEQIAFFKK